MRWGRIILAVLAAEAMPILLLIGVVIVYSLTPYNDSLPAEEFAPRAGNWVGPIGGFFATLLCGWWAAKPGRCLTHGSTVGIATALLDFSIGILAGGADAIQPIFFLSNAGRIIAGVLGGWLALRGRVD